MQSHLIVDAPLRQSSGSNRLAHLDALRAIAALLVVWMHTSQSYYQRMSPETLGTRWVYDSAMFVDVGRIGVVLFFAISGFVIPFSIHADGPAPVRDFLLRRAFRIFPAYWLSIPLGAYACVAIWGFPITPLLLLQNATLLEYWFGWPPVIGLYWSLAFETTFYLICATLLLLRSIENYALIATMAGGIMTLEFASIVLYHSGNATTIPYNAVQGWFYLAIMLWGTLFRAWLDGRLTNTFALASTWLMTAFLLLLYPAYCAYSKALPWHYFLPYPIAAFLFVAGTTFAKLRWRLLQWLGEISYSIYLLHPVVFSLVLWLILRAPPTSAWRTRHLAFYVIGNAALTVLVAAFTYRWVEKPAIALGRRLSNRWFGAHNVVARSEATQPARS